MAVELIDVSLLGGNLLKAFLPFLKNILPQQKFSPKDIDPVLLPMHRCKGLIAFVSLGMGKTSAKEAIKFHAAGSDEKSLPKLKHVWLLYSPASANNAEEIRTYAATYPISCDMIQLDLSNDVQNVKRIKDQIDKIAERALQEGISHEDVAIDLTGGTVMVSLGFFLAGLIYGFNLQVLIPNKIDQDGRAIPDAGSSPFTLALSNFGET